MSNALLTRRSTPPRVVVALDIDGCVLPVALPDAARPSNDREPGWAYRRCPELHFGSIIAEPVLRLLQDLHGADHVDVFWHSSWWTDSWDINTQFRMPRWPMLATEGEFLRDEHVLGHGRNIDWKSAAILRALDTLGPEDLLVWVDDEIYPFLERDELTHDLEMHPRLVMVQPETFAGITSHELAQIRAAARI